MAGSKYIYFFGDGKAEGNAKMRGVLGGKGANLAEMTNLKIPVPPGFTITTSTCIHYYNNKKRYPAGLMDEIKKNVKRLEGLIKKGFGDKDNPLLVSVRSGARFSMPGMMDTVLNLGLNDQTVDGLSRLTKNARFAFDAYRRFMQMFGNVVLGLEHEKFEKILQRHKDSKRIKLDTQLELEDLKQILEKYKKMIRKLKGFDLPEDVWEQLRMTIDAVFNSWNNPRAITYRNLNKIPHDLGTAVNIQTMVFGNIGEDSGTGVAFTRNPATGEKRFYGEYLMNAQGEDVVAGIRTPEPIKRLKNQMPLAYKRLIAIYKRLERHYRDMQDLEFTIENKRLYLLQTRTGKRTAQAAVKIAVDMVKEGLINKKEALLRVTPEQIDQLLHPMFDPSEKLDVVAKGLAASPGAAVGKVVFSSHKAITLAEEGEKVVLVRPETSPDDVGGMAASQGILTAVGGLTSHAAIVGRGMGKPCIVGCGEITINEEQGNFRVKDLVVKEGDYVSLNGSTGEVILGKVKLVEPQVGGEFKQVMNWADEIRTLGVRTNADTPQDAKVARDFGAQGIGLCRTEHMFFAKDRIPIMQEMILAEEEPARKKALERLLPMQKADFKEIFRVMKGLPVTIRLLDPPLHEFLPQSDEGIKRLSKKTGLSVNRIKEKITSLKEFNPMLGHRGCRLGITYPEIVQMQAKAIFEAACELVKEGERIIPEVMIPLVSHVNELRITKNQIVKLAKETQQRFGVKLRYSVGTMIEVPRAAITAEEIAKEAEFFSFGTNDLTQMSFGFSRDDAGKFLPLYVKEGILEKDPFMSVDQSGVGELMKIGIEKGRKNRPNLKIGICGEHGGEPASVEFCHRIGLDYVSCSPYRVPIARLAAAQATLKE